MNVPTNDKANAAVHVIVADDHPIINLAVRHTINTVPDLHVVACARSGSELVSLLEKKRCDLIVTDFSMNTKEPSYDGLQLIRYLKRTFPNIPIVVFTMLANSGVLYELGKLQVAAVVSKEDEISTLAQICLRVLSSSEVVLSPSILANFASNGEIYNARGRPQRLSPREIEVVRLFALGVPITEIANRLHRTTATIGTQKRSAMRKLRISSNVDLIRYANEHGLL